MGKNAGRRSKLTSDRIKELRKRYEAGERVTALAKECGISRQALYKHFRNAEYIPLRIEYLVDGETTTTIEVDLRRKSVHIENDTAELSKRAFGLEDRPEWMDLLAFLEGCYMKKQAVTEKGTYLLQEGGNGFSLMDLEGRAGNREIHIHVDSDGTVPLFQFSKKDMLLYRSDTDGYQLKAVTSDRRCFVKAQAIMAGVRMRDWAVEIIATRLCHQLGIACVEQKYCRMAYAGQVLDAVYAPNFELDGYTFLSFESLLGRMNRSTAEEEFIRMDALSKLRWCAQSLSEISGIPYEMTEKYMLDLAVLDCLLGNVDRHSRNFGLLFRCDPGQYRIAPVFDSGMGLFEHDYYRDNYKTFEEAMQNVYVSPYGEDPFELLALLDREYHLKQRYPDMGEPDYGEELHTVFALEYEERMKKAWRNLD